MTAPVGGPATLEGVRADLLSRLGLDDRATADDLAEAHETVELFLASAPRHLAAWARRQASAADEAYALLTDPAALARTVALGVRANRPDPAPGGPATPPVRREPSPASTPSASTRAKSGKGSRTAAAATDTEPTDDELAQLIASVTPSAHRDSVRGGPAVAADSARRAGCRLRPARPA